MTVRDYISVYIYLSLCLWFSFCACVSTFMDIRMNLTFSHNVCFSVCLYIFESFYVCVCGCVCVSVFECEIFFVFNCLCEYMGLCGTLVEL